jgi:hypothetical protein
MNTESGIDNVYGMRIVNRYFEHLAHIKIFRKTVVNQNLFQQEIKRRMYSGNISYQSVQNLLSSHLLVKKMNIRMYKSIMLSVF